MNDLSQNFLTLLNQYLKKLEYYKIEINKQDNSKVFYFNEVMFGILEDNRQPIILSLRCDKKLGDYLKSNYEEVVNPKKVSPKNWISIVITGQLKPEEVLDLLRHSYEVAKKISIEE
jgi:predicted DNA-binding protein (MmcQ/YjbR family)